MIRVAILASVFAASTALAHPGPAGHLHGFGDLAAALFFVALGGVAAWAMMRRSAAKRADIRRRRHD